MRTILFDKPVKVAFGKRGRSRTVKTISEALRCLGSDEWPAKNRPFTQMARGALDGTKTGHVTPAEARQAFEDAALASRLVVRN